MLLPRVDPSIQVDPYPQMSMSYEWYVLFLMLNTWFLKIQLVGSMFNVSNIHKQFFIMYKRQEMGREPTVDGVFLWTHTRKEDIFSWVDERSKRTYVSVYWCSVDVVYILGVAVFGFQPLCCFSFKYTNGSSKVDCLQKNIMNVSVKKVIIHFIDLCCMIHPFYISLFLLIRLHNRIKFLHAICGSVI